MTKPFNINNYLCFLGLLLSFTSCQPEKKGGMVDALPYYQEASFTPVWMSKDDPALAGFHQISPFQLMNQDGGKVTEKTFEGKVYVANFFFTICPGICPKMTSNMAIIQAEFRKDNQVLLASHSVTPNIDSVSVLQQYALSEGVQSGKWHLLTGERDQIYKLGREDYFVEEDLGIEKDLDEFLHTENFVLIDQNRHIRGIYNGLNKASVNQLIQDIHTLKKEQTPIS